MGLRRQLRPQDKDGYLAVFPRGKSVRVHRLVAIAFVPNPHGKPHVNHIDGNKKNNRAENLEWATHQENIRHAYDTGLARNGSGEMAGNAKLTAANVAEIRAIYRPRKPGVNLSALGARFGVTPQCIWRVVHNKVFA